MTRTVLHQQRLLLFVACFCLINKTTEAFQIKTTTTKSLRHVQTLPLEMARTPKLSKSIFSSSRTDVIGGPATAAATATATAVVPSEILSFGTKVTGYSFAALHLLKGIACTFAPSRSLKFIGLEKSSKKSKASDKDSLDRVPSAVEFLMTWGGGLSMSIGLTAALALRLESQLKGQLPSLTSMYKCIYIGLLPQLFTLLKLLSFKRWPTNLQLNTKKNTLLGVLLGLCISVLTIGGIVVEPALPTLCLSVVFFILGLNTIRNPSTIFKDGKNTTLTEGEELAYDVADVARNVTADAKVGQLADDAVSTVTQTLQPEESYVGRQFGLVMMVYATLIHMLRNPVVNVLPSIGFAALAQALGNLFITYGTDDVKNINEPKFNTNGLVANIATNVAIAGVCLRHFLLP